MLFDLLVHPEGPRLRDRVSHGEVDIKHLPQPLATYTLGLCAALCIQRCSDLTPDQNVRLTLPHSQ